MTWKPGSRDELPTCLAGQRRYYQPTDEGRERQLKQRMQEIAVPENGSVVALVAHVLDVHVETWG